VRDALRDGSDRRLSAGLNLLAAGMVSHFATLTGHRLAASLFFWIKRLIRKQTANSRHSRPHEQKNDNECRTGLRHQLNGTTGCPHVFCRWFRFCRTQQFRWRSIGKCDSITAWQKPAHRKIWKDTGQARPKKWLRGQRTQNNRCRTMRIPRVSHLRRDPTIPPQADQRAEECVEEMPRLLPCFAWHSRPRLWLIA
jgi:hypothetical protein